MPRRLRRLSAPEPALADDAIRLEPLSRALVPAMRWVTEPDTDTARFTYIPTSPDEVFLESWLGRYEDGWGEGSRAGFAVRDEGRDAVGFAAFVKLDLDAAEGELGYVVAPAARGRGIASRAVGLLTDWGLGELGLDRIELRIDPANTASSRVAERNGYRLEGVLRSVAFKEGLRSDVAVWSRLARD
ncbi:MAG TPA: GNAT family N-acetyltransferase [Gaiellaceae bacterium]|nr:GNAT family N-acetyltransferase [Gaiellaceae bacterium]